MMLKNTNNNLDSSPSTTPCNSFPKFSFS